MTYGHSIDSLRAIFQGGARPNSFRVTLPFPVWTDGNTQNFSLYCKAASLPSVHIGVVEVPFMGRKMPVQGDMSFDPITLTIINDSKFQERRACESWLNGMQGNETNVGLVLPDSYSVNVIIDQLGKTSDEILYSYKLVGAFPTKVGEIQLSYDTNDSIEEFTLDLSYAYWLPNSTR